MKTKHSGIALLLAVNLLLAALYLSWGLFTEQWQTVRWQLIVELRIPALLTALVVGLCLPISAALLQILLNNPLADPGIIGLNSGASLGAALILLGAISLGLSPEAWLLPAACFIGAVISAALIYLLAKRIGALSPAAVILAGIAISTVSGAIIAWLYVFADGQQIRSLTFWLMGSLHQAPAMLLFPAITVTLVLVGGLFMTSHRLNWLYLGPDMAQARGLNVKRYEAQLLFIAAALVAIAVSLAGSIAFIGLLIPHFVRQLWGFDHRQLLPLSGLLGVLCMQLVLLVSLFAQGWLLPVSLLTATIGGPLFIWVLIKSQGRGQFATR